MRSRKVSAFRRPTSLSLFAAEKRDKQVEVNNNEAGSIDHSATMNGGIFRTSSVSGLEEQQTVPTDRPAEM